MVIAFRWLTLQNDKRLDSSIAIKIKWLSKTKNIVNNIFKNCNFVKN